MGKIRLGFCLFLLCVIALISRAQQGNGFEQRKEQAFRYCLGNQLDTNLCVMVDMSIHSGKNRLFVVNFKTDSLMLKGLCSHGNCNGSNGPKPLYNKVQFSNTPGSYCSSLGHYKVGARAWSNWGINVHYKLHGLDSTNNNAYKRIVVLHSFAGVENKEIYPNEAMTSWGCPMVSDEKMKRLDELLKNKKDVLLWIYN